MTSRTRTPSSLLLVPMVAWTAGCSEPVAVEAGDLSDRVEDISASVQDEVGSVVVVGWEQLSAADGWVEYSSDGETWRTSPPRTFDEGAQEQLLLGIPYETDVSLRLVQTGSEGTATSETAAISTSKLPNGIPTPTVLTADADRYDPDRPWLLAGVRDWTVIIDRQGQVVWALETPSFRATLQPQPSSDGTDLLIDHGSFWALFDGGDRSQVQRTKIDGSVVSTDDTPGLHHPFTELADGSLVWAAMDDAEETLQRLAPDGTQAPVASCVEVLGSLGEEGYCGSNTIRYDQQRGSYLWSFYSHETVVELDGSTGEVLNVFGRHEDAWDFDPPESGFWWQHGAYFTDTGTLLVSSYVDTDDDELVVREYELDEDEQVLRQVWSFRGEEAVHGATMGEAWRLPGGNTLHNYGEGKRVREATPEGEVVWDVSFDGGGLLSDLGRTTPLADLYDFAP